MGSNKTGYLLMASGLVALAISLKAVFFSGSDVEGFPLQGKHGNTYSVRVDPHMNPMRLLISMDYGTKAYNSIAQRYIEYVVSAKGEDGRVLWTEDGRASVNSDKKGVVNNTHHASLQTFDVDEEQEILFSYDIRSENLRYKGAELTLKANVTRHKMGLTVFGVIFLVAGLLIVVNNQKKKQS